MLEGPADRLPYPCDRCRWLTTRPQRRRCSPLLQRNSGGNMRENLKYCVILPAFNEGRHLATVVGRIPDWVDGIIVVDDASTDDTLKVAESLADPRVRVRHHAMSALRLLRRCENLATDRYHVPG